MKNSITADVTDSGIVDLRTQQERLVERLEEVGADTQRIVNVNDGEKRSQDHTQRYANEILGNYGVYAGRGANGEKEKGYPWLLQFDVDAYQCGRDELLLLDTLPETFKVESPHTKSDDGGHLYFAFDGDAASVIEDSANGTRNPNTVWGSIRVEGQLVVGPGSQIEKGEYGCNKDHCDECADENGGFYRISKDEPIQFIDEDDLRLIVETDWIGPDSSETVEEANTPELEGVEQADDREIDLRNLGWQCSELPYEEIEDGFYPGGRLRTAFESKTGEKIRNLWMGNYKQAGFGKDRSKAETALVNHLGWYMKSNWSMVSMLMDFSCQQFPTTEWGTERKWAERGSDYHESLSQYSQHEGYLYDGSGPNWDLDSEERPEVGHPTLRQIRNILKAIGIGSKKEIMEYEADESSDWDEIDRSETQVKEALSTLEDMGLIHWYRNGRSVDYYLSPMYISEDRFDEKGINQQEIWKNYLKSW